MIAKGQRIFLRFPELHDASTLLKWENDPKVWEHGDNKEEYTLKQIEDFIELGQDLKKNGQARYMICQLADERAVGCIDLYDFNKVTNAAGVGILVYDQSDRNKGFGREALRLLTDYCKHKLKMKALFCRILSENEISLALFEKEGFHFKQLTEYKRAINDPVYLELPLN